MEVPKFIFEVCGHNEANTPTIYPHTVVKWYRSFAVVEFEYYLNIFDTTIEHTHKNKQSSLFLLSLPSTFCIQPTMSVSVSLYLLILYTPYHILFHIL